MAICRRVISAHLDLLALDPLLLRILPRVLGFALYSMTVCFVLRQYDLNLSAFRIAPLTLAAAPLWIHMMVRNNAAYERCWAARKLACTLVSEIRNLARAATSFIPERSEQRALLMEALAFCHFLRGQLRKTGSTNDAAFADMEARLANPADEMIRRMCSRTQSYRSLGAVDSIGFGILDERLTSISGIQSECEQIAARPMAFAHSLLVHRMAFIACLLLPIALNSTTGWASPVFTAMIAYSFFGLDALSEELEDPFAAASDHPGLDGLFNACEISVFETLGETPPKMILN
ncbi:hypothetical protein IED13_24380 [Bosea sp. SSUT16]|uniref:Bestrophin n=1 Tax=Bosea spartocytisi TaxID=2773451 RepID=A0A927I2R0_9HYPH|nr:bestrophin family ion channel [Bosea spartocytisi]MBD3848847.1 hypothetical protein [Bosea spartocytisi]